MTIRTLLASAAIAATALLGAGPAAAQDFYMGQIITLGSTFCPNGTLEAAGQMMAISQNAALFSLYGTTYGGNGSQTFALPDLRAKPGAAGPALKTCIVTSGLYPSRP